MAFVDPRVADLVAHLDGVKAAVVLERDRIATVARELFAAHDHPGRHEITTGTGQTDAVVSLEGPAPLAVELGHWTKDHKKFVEGLHVLGRAAASG